MNAIIDYLFGAASFVPHGYCLLWRPDLVAIHAISDALIALSYFVIPFGIWHFARHRTDLEFKPVFFLFAAFILFCGITHLVALTTLWLPIYGAQGLMKAATAAVSLASAYALWPTIPKALAIPGLSSLRKANEDMAEAVSDREALVAARTAELTAANRELEAFAYSVAHDLRTPLRSINGFSDALAEEQGNRLDASGKQMVERIRRASLRMGNLIDDLLNMSRLTRTPIQVSAVNISELAEAIIDDFRRDDPGRAVKVDITQDIVVNCDANLMRIALTHLLSNAWKFTAKRADAHIELDCAQRQGKHIFGIRDNGVGFDMAYAGKLFFPFQRLHSEAEFPGNGIGLAIAARIIRRHGGDISAEASLGKGTTINFSI
jgi:signal transduction histidine kinase